MPKRVLVIVPFPLDDEGVANRRLQAAEIDLGLVTPTRSGRNISYALHDEHVALLIDQAVYHLAHRRIGLTQPFAQD